MMRLSRYMPPPGYLAIIATATLCTVVLFGRADDRSFSTESASIAATEPVPATSFARIETDSASFNQPEILSRPLLSQGRRVLQTQSEMATTSQPVAVSLPAPEAPTPPAPPEMSYLGYVRIGDQPEALIVSGAEKSEAWVPLGGHVGDWVLRDIQDNSVRLVRGQDEITVKTAE